MTTGKTIVLTRWAFVGKVMSLLFNMLFMWILSSKEQVTFNVMATVISPVILESKKIKSLIVSPYICQEVMRSNA